MSETKILIGTVVETIENTESRRLRALQRIGELTVYGETSAFEMPVLKEIVKKCDSVLDFYKTVENK